MELGFFLAPQSGKCDFFFFISDKVMVSHSETMDVDVFKSVQGSTNNKADIATIEVQIVTSIYGVNKRNVDCFIVMVR